MFLNQTLAQELNYEKERIMTNHRKMESKKATKIGIISAGILLVPVIICLICNIATGQGLDCFLIVLLSLMVVASVTVVPLIVAGNKIMCSIISLIELITAVLGTSCVYSNGNWFGIAVVPSVAGMLVCAMPYIINNIKLPEVIKNQKAFITIFVDTVALYSIIVTIGIYLGDVKYWKSSLISTTYSVILPWIILVISRYMTLNRMLKGALISAVSTVMHAFVNDIIYFSIGEFQGTVLTKADFSNWNEQLSSNGNSTWIIIIVGTMVTVGFVVAGLSKRTDKN